MKKMWLCFSLVFIIIGCGTEENIDLTRSENEENIDVTENEENIDATGFWNGTWADPITFGQINIELIQEENILRGECVLNGNPCINEFKIWGIIDDEGNTTFLGADIHLPTEEIEALDPLTPREDFVALEMEHIAKMEGVFSENQLEVNFDIINWEFCSNINGTFSLTRN